MAVFQGVGEGQLFALDDRGMVELVKEDIVVASCDARYYAAVGLKAGREKDSAVFAKKVGKELFELLVQVEGAVEERTAGAAGAVFVNGGLGGFFDLGVVGEAEVAVGAEHQHAFAVHDDFGVLVARNGTEIRINPLLFDNLGLLVFGQFLLQWLHQV